MAVQQRTRRIAAALLVAAFGVKMFDFGFVPSPFRSGQKTVQDVGSKMARREMLGAMAGSMLLPSSEAGAFDFEHKEDQIATFSVKDGDDGEEHQIKVRLHPDWAPRGVKRFKALARSGYLDDSAVFHVDGKTAQFGLPAEPGLTPDHIKDDTPRVGNVRGTLAFAQTRSDRRVDELFFNVADNNGLDRKNIAPIGEVVEGMDVVDQFYSGYRRRPNRADIKMTGNQYLDAEFPLLSKIKNVEVSGIES
eukprot:TRINITY_DN5950_c2_g1_i1.p1 TRINITY_DN5950_c2_g1~~TRINITY_DN5950_c2_g1_i1.p1  ORF type:complete len:249 (-),score=48.57 TRINITY_DN5950_c2_g1_i1:264-1010(-)